MQCKYQDDDDDTTINKLSTEAQCKHQNSNNKETKQTTMGHKQHVKHSTC